MFFKKNNFNHLLISKNIKLSFSFVSYAPSHFILNFKVLNFNLNENKKKILVKQSYILLTWFYYFSSINISKKKKINFSYLPIKKKIFTMTKGPMAHKNWAKEQYKFQFYLFKITIKNELKTKINIKLNYFILIFLITKNNFISYETNLFFLKNYYIILNIYDINYFNYYRLK